MPDPPGIAMFSDSSGTVTEVRFEIFFDIPYANQLGVSKEIPSGVFFMKFIRESLQKFHMEFFYEFILKFRQDFLEELFRHIRRHNLIQFCK